MQCYASTAVHAVICVTSCIVSKWLNLWSRKQRPMIACELEFIANRNLGKTVQCPPPWALCSHAVMRPSESEKPNYFTLKHTMMICISWEEYLKNDQFCVKCDVKRSVQQSVDTNMLTTSTVITKPTTVKRTFESIEVFQSLSLVHISVQYERGAVQQTKHRVETTNTVLAVSKDERSPSIEPRQVVEIQVLLIGRTH